MRLESYLVAVMVGVGVGGGDLREKKTTALIWRSAGHQSLLDIAFVSYHPT